MLYSQEEIESLREKMQAQTSLVVVGSADDALRVSKNKRRIEGVTQAMVDHMIMVRFITCYFFCWANLSKVIHFILG